MNDPQQQQARRRKGCLFYGCLTLVVLLLAVLIGGGLGSYFLYKKAEAFVEEYAASEPMELPEIQHSEVQREQFAKRLEIFANGLAEGLPTVPLVLKGDDLNMLLSSAEDLGALAEGVRLSAEGDQIKGIMSLKLGDLGAPFFRDRYLNGEGTFRVSLADGRLDVRAADLTVNGKPLPEEYLSALRQQNLAEAANRNPEFLQTLEKLDSIVVKDGAVRVVPKPVE